MLLAVEQQWGRGALPILFDRLFQGLYVVAMACVKNHLSVNAIDWSSAAMLLSLAEGVESQTFASVVGWLYSLAKIG
jgi:hypothetical protein